jgi:hypothetical protein
MTRYIPFTCDRCSKVQQKSRGCKRNVNRKKHKPVWEIEECIVCQGKKKRCKHCHGNNRIPVYRCPNALVRDPKISRLLPAFLRYWKQGEYPDGKPYLQQSMVLVNALSVFVRFVTTYQDKMLELQRKRDKANFGS